MLRRLVLTPALVALAMGTAAAPAPAEAYEVICLDLEDAYGMRISLEDDLETVGDLVACVVAGLALKTLPRPRRPRSRGGWMSTATDRRR